MTEWGANLKFFALLRQSCGLPCNDKQFYLRFALNLSNRIKNNSSGRGSNNFSKRNFNLRDIVRLGVCEPLPKISESLQ